MPADGGKESPSRVIIHWRMQATKMAENNTALYEAAETMYTLSEDRRIRDQLEAREDRLRMERYYKRHFAEFEKEREEYFKQHEKDIKKIAELEAKLAELEGKKHGQN